ncbi:unnamed protein product [Psylliodes chrysocephalus]|uniref:Uncharacterized protein n=1 Tax=Psylliodes chrysocephalus TaxID=3402493 RepID=A0A9P0D4C6_9CUCU|nr:unnamed protein product [Psylliodes chrysocephala]
MHYCVAEIVEIEVQDHVKVKYLKRFKTTYKFVKEKDEVYDISKGNVVMVPECSGFSERQKNMFHFWHRLFNLRCRIIFVNLISKNVFGIFHELYVSVLASALLLIF